MLHIWIEGETALEYAEAMTAAYDEVKAAGYGPGDFDEVDDDTWVFGDEITVHWGEIVQTNDWDTIMAMDHVMTMLD